MYTGQEIIDNVKSTCVFPELFQKDRKGKARTYTVSVETIDGVPAVVTRSGIVGGKISQKNAFVRKGTNVGRANEKTPFEVANFKCGNKWQDAFEHNYVQDINDIDNPPKFIHPMLGLKAKKQGFPCWAQPKLDGIKSFSIRAGIPQWNFPPEDMLQSRGRKSLNATLPHIKKACDEVFGNHTNHDGEVYLHGVPLQDISGMTKKDRDGVEDLEYWVYDSPCVGVTFTDRMDKLAQVIPEDHPTIKLCPTVWVENQEQLNELRAEWIGQGYEGIITRVPDSEYGFDVRDGRCMKSKDFKDSEFTIVGHTSEEYDDKGTVRNLVIWICETETEETFHCRPKGTVKNKETLLENAEKQYGKPLTVRYLTLSNKGIPQGNPVGECIRDYE